MCVCVFVCVCECVCVCVCVCSNPPLTHSQIRWESLEGSNALAYYAQA